MSGTAGIRYGPGVGAFEASGWGAAGGVVAALIALSAAVAAAGFRWPWHDDRELFWPHVFVLTAGLVVGAIVAGSAHGQMTGAWPALIMGASAPSVIRGVLGKLEVADAQPDADRAG
jgi:hypothetical protein